MIKIRNHNTVDMIVFQETRDNKIYFSIFTSDILSRIIYEMMEYIDPESKQNSNFKPNSYYMLSICFSDVSMFEKAMIFKLMLSSYNIEWTNTYERFNKLAFGF